jgi:AcrR family transcriptional regulator
MILSAAGKVFAHEGYDRVSMRKLAKAIEYSPGTIYLHFRSKESLLNSLVEDSFSKLSSALERTFREDDPVETLRLGLRAYVEFGLRHPNHYHFAFMMKPPSAGRYRPHPAFEYLLQTVRRCIASGRFRQIDADAAAQLLWAAVHGITSLLIARPTFPWVRRGELIGKAIDNSIRGLLKET